jgi:hypothetical protein
LVALALLRVLLGYVSVPLNLVQFGTLLSTVVFISAPIFALFFAGRYEWTAKRSLIFVACGLLIHFGIGVGLGHYVFHGSGFAAAVCSALAVQVGFTMWCVGLGALLASILKDKNLLIPVSIFLVAFDIFLVLTPLGATNVVLKAMPNVLPAIGYSIPKMGPAPTTGVIGTFAYIGPADFLFMGMFFAALHRFGMRTKQTLIWLIPAILVYLVLAIFFRALPLLVPIGLTVLIVNAREFKMNKEEKSATIGVAVLLTLLILASIAYRKLRPAPSPTVVSPAVPIRANSPAPATPGRHP